MSRSFLRNAGDKSLILLGQKEVKPMKQKKKIRVLIAKPGLDGHDRGAKVIAYGLRNAGFEVIYTGPRQTPEMIVNAAIQEDVDILGLSILSGAHLSLTQRVIQNLREKGGGDKLVLIGGMIPQTDVVRLKEMGVAEVFMPGTSIRDIVDFIKAKFFT